MDKSFKMLLIHSSSLYHFTLQEILHTYKREKSRSFIKHEKQILRGFREYKDLFLERVLVSADCNEPLYIIHLYTHTSNNLLLSTKSLQTLQLIYGRTTCSHSTIY